METVVVALHRPAGETRKRTGTRVQEPDATSRHIRVDFMTSIWRGAMVECIGAAVIPPFSESRS
jgi:hypothetical protein